MTTCVVAGRAGLSELTDDFVQDPVVQNLMQRVTMIADTKEDPKLPGYAPFDLVTVTLKNGTVIESRQITAVRGGPDLPLSREQLWAKFEDCAQVGGASAIAKPLFDTLMSLENLAEVNQMPGLNLAK
jgi:2-methylcitrate dehydratase PrpD